MKRSYLMRAASIALVASLAQPTFAADAADGDAADRSAIIVTGARASASSGTKTDTPTLETPQPITVITDDVYLAQGSISISDKRNDRLPPKHE